MPCANQFSGSHVISQALLHWLQCAGRPKVLANSQSCDSLLHWIVAWAMMSSERQLEQTGVVRDACRPAICTLEVLACLPGSEFWLNGLRSDHVGFMSCPPGESDHLPERKDNS
jgi:hypothetical protein